ncbi:MAG: hypothetical protein ACR2PA_17050 [Hyphomicrobiaceae bacterium]
MTLAFAQAPNQRATEGGQRAVSNGDAIAGYSGVTKPMVPTGSGRRFDIGGGKQNGDDLDDVPWQTLKPGDVVNVFHRTEPYRHKILLSEQGTPENPIVVNGVTDAEGNRPTIHAAGAVSINPHEWDIDYASTLLLINKRKSTGRYGHNAKHYRIMNLRLTGVRSRNSYSHGGRTYAYRESSRAIWSAGGQYIVLEGMVIEDNGAGVFVQANDDPGSLSKAWTIRGSKFENNGHGARDHQIYLQAVSDPNEFNVVEGNYFGPPTPGQSSVAQLKTRSTGVVVRYNWFNSSHRTLDIVEAQDAIPDWMYRNYTPAHILSRYRSSYVYGNVFVNDFAATGGQVAGRPLHFGADSLSEGATWGNKSGKAPAIDSGMRGFQSPTYFFHNTFYMRASWKPLWRGVLFDAENNNSKRTPTPGRVEAWNNVIEFRGNTRIGAMNRTGSLHWRGANLLYTKSLTLFAESDAYAKYELAGDDPFVNVIVDSRMINKPAAFVDAETSSLNAKDFRLTANSPARGAASPLPPHLGEFPVQLQPDGQNGGAIPRPNLKDLGAFTHAE